MKNLLSDDLFVDVPFRPVKWYLLDENKEPYRVSDLSMLNARMSGPDDYKRVGLNRVWLNVEVSTVFLFLDHSFAMSGFYRPVLFETMVLGGMHDGFQERYRTWHEARRGHYAHIWREWIAPLWCPYEFFCWALHQIGCPLGDGLGLPRDYGYEYMA